MINDQNASLMTVSTKQHALRLGRLDDQSAGLALDEMASHGHISPGEIQAAIQRLYPAQARDEALLARVITIEQY